MRIKKSENHIFTFPIVIFHFMNRKSSVWLKKKFFINNQLTLIFKPFKVL